MKEQINIIHLHVTKSIYSISFYQTSSIHSSIRPSKYPNINHPSIYNCVEMIHNNEQGFILGSLPHLPDF